MVLLVWVLSFYYVSNRSDQVVNFVCFARDNKKNVELIETKTCLENRFTTPTDSSLK